MAATDLFDWNLVVFISYQIRVVCVFFHLKSPTPYDWPNWNPYNELHIAERLRCETIISLLWRILYESAENVCVNVSRCVCVRSLLSDLKSFQFISREQIYEIISFNSKHTTIGCDWILWTENKNAWRKIHSVHTRAHRIPATPSTIQSAFKCLFLVHYYD